MTILEALQAVVQVEQIPSLSLDKVLIDAGLTGSDTYSSANKDAVNSAAIIVLQGLLISSVSEGGYSISFDRSAVEARLSGLTGAGVRGVQVVNI